jgi:hypothetical protein
MHLFLQQKLHHLHHLLYHMYRVFQYHHYYLVEDLLEEYFLMHQK